MYCALIARMRWPATISELAGEIYDGLGKSSRASVNRAVKELHLAGLAHISGWKRCRRGVGPFGSVWSFGRGQDIPAPIGEIAPANPRLIRSEMLAFVGGLRALEAGPVTLAELEKISGLGRQQAQAMTRSLRDYGMAHIAAWDGRSPAWILGRGKDAKRPERMPQSVADARYRERLKAKRLQSQMHSACSKSLAQSTTVA